MMMAVAETNTIATTESTNKVINLLFAQWENQEDGVLLSKALEYLDVVTLIQKKPVCKQWESLCTKAIDNKCSNGKKKKKKFGSNNELRHAVGKYLPNQYCHLLTAPPPTTTAAEEIASTYGYPIDKWDVSNIQDFSYIFERVYLFNEPIGSWDVSNATTMCGIFYYARSFNQDISSWDVSHVTDMDCMFWDAQSFNQDISSWDVSNVTDMSYMFDDAKTFNQDISSWDVSNVTDMTYMFCRATSFNQYNIASWDVSNVKGRFYGMFYNASWFDATQLPWFNEAMVHY